MTGGDNAVVLINDIYKHLETTGLRQGRLKRHKFLQDAVVKIPLKIPGTGSGSPPKLTGLLLVRHHSRVKKNHKDSLTTAQVIRKICRIPLSCSSANSDKKKSLFSHRDPNHRHQNL